MRGRPALMLLGLWACGPAPGYELAAPEPPLDPAAPRPVASSPLEPPVAVASSPPPTPEPPEPTGDPACDQARRGTARARALAAEGWVRRPLRLLSRAAKLCPAQDQAALRGQLDQARQPPADVGSLERKLAAAEAGGDAVGARRLSAAWLTAQQASVGAKARWWRRPAARIVGATADLSSVLVAADKHGSQDPSVITVLGADGRATHVLEPGWRVGHADRAGDRVLLSGGERMEIWSLATGRRVLELSWTDESYGWGYFVDGGRRVVGVGSRGGFDGVMRLFDAQTGDSIADLAVAKGRHRRRVEHVARAGDHLALGTYDEVVVVKGGSLKVVGRVAAAKRPQGRGTFGIQALALTGAGRLAVLTTDGTARIFDGFGRARVAELTGSSRAVLAFADGGSRLLWATDRGNRSELKTYDVASERAVRSRPLPEVYAISADGERLLSGSRTAYGAFVPSMQARGGDALWPKVPEAQRLQALRLTKGLMIARERREASKRLVAHWGWYGGRWRRTLQEGYRANVVALSPSGRRVAAVLGRKGILWDMENDRAEPFDRAPGARGFPDQLVFDGEHGLRLAHERPLTTHRMADGAWTMEQGPGSLRGFGFLALSSRGAALSRDEGVLTLAPDEVLIGVDAGTATFSGNGSRIFATQGKEITWFDEAGKRQGSVSVGCEPYGLAADHEGALLAFGCDRELRTLRPPAALATLPNPAPHGVDDVYQDQHLSPSGHLLAQRTRHRARLVSMVDGQLRAELELLADQPVVAAVDGRMAYDGSPAWVAHDACRIGHRAFPLSRCEDGLRDDVLVDELLAAPTP